MTGKTRGLSPVLRESGIVVLGMAWALTAFLVLMRVTYLNPDLGSNAAIIGSALVGAVVFGVLALRQGGGAGRFLELVGWSGMVLGAWFMVLILASRLAQFIVIPADIVGFGENGFINFILKFREGFPLYTPGPDNNTVPYTPAAPILTYLIASLVGDGTSIVLLRAVTTATGAVAGIVFAFVAANLAALVHGDRFGHRVVWIATWAGLLVLVAFDARFNLYMHTLHNDPAALLVAAVAFWVMTRHALTGRAWLLGLMVVLPSVGFMIKQSHLMWIAVFPLYLLISGRVRQAFLVGGLAAVVYAATLGLCWLAWGPDFYFWVFAALGAKEVSAVRIVYHLLEAGVPIGFFVFGAWGAVLTRGRSPALAIWLCSILVLLLGVWTSGAVWVHNHLGPGAMMAACWFFTGLIGVRPRAERADDRPSIPDALRFGLLAFSLIAFFAGIGYLANPRERLPEDLYRYIAETEAEFDGMDPARVMLDNGNWIYLRTGTLMRDRATPLAVHIGPNQSVMNLPMLDDTKARIRSGIYDKILAHDIDNPRTAYDFGNRGSGIPALIYEHYTEVRRIAAVDGITEWWPRQMVSEIVVLVRNDLVEPPADDLTGDGAGSADQPGDRETAHGR